MPPVQICVHRTKTDRIKVIAVLHPSHPSDIQKALEEAVGNYLDRRPKPFRVSHQPGKEIKVYRRKRQEHVLRFFWRNTGCTLVRNTTPNV